MVVPDRSSARPSLGRSQLRQRMEQAWASTYLNITKPNATASAGIVGARTRLAGASTERPAAMIPLRSRGFTENDLPPICTLQPQSSPVSPSDDPAVAVCRPGRRKRRQRPRHWRGSRRADRSGESFRARPRAAKNRTGAVRSARREGQVAELALGFWGVKGTLDTETGGTEPLPSHPALDGQAADHAASVPLTSAMIFEIPSPADLGEKGRQCGQVA